jgi:predicted RNase H-related nuclease YkuK (DUF458 family)
MFHSPTYGPVTLDVMHNRITSFISVDHEEQYSLIVGTDSQPRNGSGVDFVTAVIVHRKGKGGIYFWKRVIRQKKYVLRQRMYEEAMLSLDTAETILKLFEKDGITKYNMEIHVDIGPSGQTKEMIAEIVGMIRGSGYMVKTKPESYGASKVADRYT